MILPAFTPPGSCLPFQWHQQLASESGDWHRANHPKESSLCSMFHLYLRTDNSHQSQFGFTSYNYSCKQHQLGSLAKWGGGRPSLAPLRVTTSQGFLDRTHGQPAESWKAQPASQVSGSSPPLHGNEELFNLVLYVGQNQDYELSLEVSGQPK